ncbi:hypothetical protein [Angelakisella massiliensis]|nr:hypothetical protein [Angelakisella massiliensis]
MCQGEILGIAMLAVAMMMGGTAVGFSMDWRIKFFLRAFSH